MLVHPYLDAYRAFIGAAATSEPRPHAELNAVFESTRLARFAEEPVLHFVPCPKKPKRRKRGERAPDAASSYDGSIALRREVPTREADLHDHCNFLVWLAFPRSKRAIHERQFRAKERWIEPGSRALPGARTREQDALTLFDEGGMVTVVGGDGSSHSFAFGHALLEHFVRSTEPIAATELRIRLEASASADAIDRALALRIEDPREFLAPGLDGLLRLQSDGSMAPVDRPQRMGS